MGNLARKAIYFPASIASSWDVVGKGDFNGDGTSDVLYMKDAGDTAVAEFTNTSRSGLKFPGGVNPIWSVQGIGDFNGDGTDDVLLRRSTDHITMMEVARRHGKAVLLQIDSAAMHRAGHEFFLTGNDVPYLDRFGHQGPRGTNRLRGPN